MADCFEVTIITDKIAESEIEFFSILQEKQLFESEKYVNGNQLTFKVIVDKGSIKLVYHLFSSLYHAGFDETKIIFQSNTYFLSDSELSYKFYGMLYGVEGFNHHEGRILCTLIGEKKISNFDELISYAKKPFSGYLPIEKAFRLIKLNLLSEDAVLSISHIDVTLENRIIEEDITVEKTNKVEFSNCIINGDINIYSVQSVSFWNCIINGRISLVCVENVILSESNIQTVAIINSTLTKYRIFSSNIYNHFCVCSKLNNLEWISNRFHFTSIDDCKSEASIFNLKQLKISNISISQFKKIDRKAPSSFFTNYDGNILKTTHLKRKRKISEPILNTLYFLQENGEQQMDKKNICDVKYKIALYSTSGLKRCFVFLTGAYYKPHLWVIYYIFLYLICSLLYILLSSQFEILQSVPLSFKSVSLGDAFIYSLSVVTGFEFLFLKPIGLSLNISVLQKILSPVIIGNFFVSLIKRNKI